MNPPNTPPPSDEELNGSTSLSGSGSIGDFRPSPPGITNLPVSDEAGKLQPGELLGDYEIISLLGVGGMGFVYKARHRVLNKIYALKTLNYEKVNETAWRRLQLEAQAIARMNHPEIIAIHNVGLHDGVLPFYVMDLLEGETLADRLARSGPLSIKEAIPLFILVASGLGYAHKKGIIHRDIKPGNIFLLKERDAAGSPLKLVDFGLAKLSGVEPEVQNPATAGELFGSPYYMSPEHCDGKRIDARSDIYSLGCTFFEILTGVPPFRGANSIQTMMMHQGQKPSSLSKATGGKFFPEAMEEMIATMLEKAPMDRYQNLEEVVVELTYMQQDLDASSSSSSSSSSRNSEQSSFGKDGTKEKHPVQLALKISLAVAVLLSAILTLAYWMKIEQEKSFSDPPRATMRQPTSSPGDKTGTSPESNGRNRAEAIAETTEGTESPGSSEAIAGTTASTAAAATPELNAESSVGSTAGTSPTPNAEAKSVSSSPSIIKPSASRPTKGYFLGNVDDQGVLKRKFDFGVERNLGKLELEGQEELIPASGVVLLPQGKATLHCSNVVITDPSLLEGFSSNDLYGLVFAGREPLDKSALRYIIRLSGLKYLSVSASPCNFDGDSLSQIELLFDLKELELVGTRIKGSELATLSRIKKLKRLTYSPVTEPANLLRVLTPSKSLTELTLERGPLSLSDFKAISTCPNLRHLRVNETGMTNECMEAINSLSRLKELRANPSLLDRDCLKSLKKLKNLQVLGIGGPKFDASDSVDFSKALGIPVN